MSDVGSLLTAINSGDPHAAEQLLPLVYDELRRLAASKLSNELPGQTLQATALVHEAYIRLVDGSNSQRWDGRGHFFAAAAEAMRRILVDRARGKNTAKRGGDRMRLDLDVHSVATEDRDWELLALDEGLNALDKHDHQAASLVKLRYFAGLNRQEAADALGITPREGDRLWTLARAWLYQRMKNR